MQTLCALPAAILPPGQRPGAITPCRPHVGHPRAPRHRWARPSPARRPRQPRYRRGGAAVAGPLRARSPRAAATRLAGGRAHVPAARRRSLGAARRLPISGYGRVTTVTARLSRPLPAAEPRPIAARSRVTREKKRPMGAGCERREGGGGGGGGGKGRGGGGAGFVSSLWAPCV